MSLLALLSLRTRLLLLFAVTLAVLLLTAAAGMLGVHRQSQLASELAQRDLGLRVPCRRRTPACPICAVLKGHADSTPRSGQG